MADGPNSSDKRKFAVMLARYSAIGLMLPASTFVGWLIGAALDKWLHTTWIYLAGLILGSVAGFIELIRTVSSESKN